MSRFRTSAISNLPQSKAHAICLAAISQLEWNIAGVARTRIACQELVLPDNTALCPVRIAIVLSPTSEGTTELTLHGVSFGYEPLQSARVRERVEQLLAAIEDETARLPPQPAPVSMPAFRTSAPPGGGRLLESPLALAHLPVAI
ncbi:MAG: hypothetical protein U1E38_09160 [Rhodospirillales bacterium]